MKITVKQLKQMISEQLRTRPSSVHEMVVEIALENKWSTAYTLKVVLDFIEEHRLGIKCVDYVESRGTKL